MPPAKISVPPSPPRPHLPIRWRCHPVRRSACPLPRKCVVVGATLLVLYARQGIPRGIAPVRGLGPQVYRHRLFRCAIPCLIAPRAPVQPVVTVVPVIRCRRPSTRRRSYYPPRIGCPRLLLYSSPSLPFPPSRIFVTSICPLASRPRLLQSTYPLTEYPRRSQCLPAYRPLRPHPSPSPSSPVPLLHCHRKGLARHLPHPIGCLLPARHSPRPPSNTSAPQKPYRESLSSVSVRTSFPWVPLRVAIVFSFSLVQPGGRRLKVNRCSPLSARASIRTVHQPVRQTFLSESGACRFSVR